TSTSIKHEPGSERSTGSPEDEQQQSLLGGRYLIFSSTCGALGVPGLGPYSATKHAVEGLIESMLYETHAFNIKATLVEPGHLQPDNYEDNIDASTSSAEREESRRKPGNKTNTSLLSSTHFQYKPPHPNSPYNTPTSPAAHPIRVLAWLSKSSSQPQNQPLTSTARCAEVVWQLGHCAYPPLRLLLGAFAVESMRDRLRCVIEEIEEWRWLGFDDGEEGEGEGEGREGSREVKAEEDGDGDEDGANDGVEDGEDEGDVDGDRDEEMELDGSSSSSSSSNRLKSCTAVT
ncbi:MAG: hypothetical protein L6R42_008210, partial [Xanthoria sp. 1 TBL-2021]